MVPTPRRPPRAQNQDFSICKSTNGRTIKVTNFGFEADYTVKIIESYSFGEPDVTIFNNSKILNMEEIIAVLFVPNISLIDIIK